MENFESQKQTLRERLSRQKQQQARTALGNALREEYQQLRESGDIVVNNQYVF
jgi:uncharacterized protein YllA (UPF0747 family)